MRAYRTISASTASPNPVRRPRAIERLVVLVLALACSVAWAEPLTFMNYNLYLGADLAPLLTASSQQQFVIATGAAYANVLATPFTERANAIADQIAAARPDFVGLQEVTTWRTGPGLNPAPATNVSFDDLALLSAALAARGVPYVPVAQVTNSDIEAPALLPSGLTDVRLTDHDVLLARADLPAGVSYANAQAQNYASAVHLVVAGVPVTLLAGWVSIDVTAGGQTFRLVSTHLDATNTALRLAQVAELLGGPAGADMPVVLIGDLNASASPPSATADPAYLALLAAGFRDAGLIGGAGDDPTCCQAADLRNALSQLDTRIDLALFRGPFAVHGATVVGDDPADRTASGLWPSDHASLVTRLSLVPEPATLALAVGALVLLPIRRRRDLH